MLFLYRPRQTWMPMPLPRKTTDQDLYRYHQQESFEATRRVAPPLPTPEAPRDPVADLNALAQLHSSGGLTDDEFASAKAKVLDMDRDS